MDILDHSDFSISFGQTIREFVARRTRKHLGELRGKIRFSEGYDYTAHRKGK